MDYRETLMEMVREARNLPREELEPVPGTNPVIMVKKGRVAELFSSVQNDIELESEEYYNAKAAEIALANKDAMERLRKVSENLTTINTNYDKLTNQLLELQKRGTTDKESLDKLIKDIGDYADYKVRATNIIIDIKNEVNANFVSAIREQMDGIRNSFLTSPRGTEVGYGDNGLSILASDKPEYDSLIGLLRLMNEINQDEEIVNVDGIMCVNKSQVEKAHELLSKTQAFDRVKIKSVEDLAKEANPKLINEILAEKKHIEELIAESKVAPIYEADNGFMVTPAYRDRYNNLLKALKYLNTANDRGFALTPVWDGIAYVEGPDKDAFIELMRSTEPLNKYDPMIKQIEENNNLIKELEEYLLSMEREYNEYDGVTNIPSALTDDNTQIIDRDGNLTEYNNILKLINLLKDVNAQSLTNVYGIGNVKYDNIPEFKRLISSIKKLRDRIPEPIQNKREMDKIKKRLEELNRTAQEEIKKDPSLKLAANGVVLDRDLPEYEALIEKLRCLEASKGSDNLVPVGEAMIDADFEDSYRKASEKIEPIKDPEIEPPTQSELEKDFSLNDDKLEEIEKIIQDLKDAAQDAIEGAQPTEATRVSVGEVTSDGMALISSFKILNQDSDKFFALLDIKECLKNAKISNNLIAIDGILIDNDDKDKYLEAMAKLKDIEKAKLENSDEKKLEKIKNNNAAHYPNLDADINRLQANGESEELNALLTIKNCLDNVKDVNNLQEFDGVMIDVNDYSDYIEAIATLDKIKNSTAEHNKSLEGLADEVRNKKGKNPESKRKKVSIRQLKDKLKFKKKRKEVATKGIIKTVWEKVSKGTMKAVEAFQRKKLLEIMDEKKDIISNLIATQSKEKKGIQEQVEEELDTEEQKVAAEIGQNVTKQIMENSNERMQLKKRLSDIIIEQSSLKEGTPEYEALEKEANELISKIDELKGITPETQIDLDPVLGSNEGKDSTLTSSGGTIDPSQIFAGVDEEIEEARKLSTAHPKPVVEVPPVDAILDNLDDKRKKEDLLRKYNYYIGELNSPYAAPEWKMQVARELDVVIDKLTKLGVSIPEVHSPSPEIIQIPEIPIDNGLTPPTDYGQATASDPASTPVEFVFTPEEQDRMAALGVDSDISKIISDYQEAVKNGNPLKTYRNYILYKLGLSINEYTENDKVDIADLMSDIRSVLQMSDEELIGHFSNNIKHNEDLINSDKLSEDLKEMFIQDNKRLTARVQELETLTKSEASEQVSTPVVISLTQEEQARLKVLGVDDINKLINDYINEVKAGRSGRPFSMIILSRLGIDIDDYISEDKVYFDGLERNVKWVLSMSDEELVLYFYANIKCNENLINDRIYSNGRKDLWIKNNEILRARAEELETSIKMKNSEVTLESLEDERKETLAAMAAFTGPEKYVDLSYMMLEVKLDMVESRIADMKGMGR